MHALFKITRQFCGCSKRRDGSKPFEIFGDRRDRALDSLRFEQLPLNRIALGPVLLELVLGLLELLLEPPPLIHRHGYFFLVVAQRFVLLELVVQAPLPTGFPVELLDAIFERLMFLLQIGDPRGARKEGLA